MTCLELKEIEHRRDISKNKTNLYIKIKTENVTVMERDRRTLLSKSDLDMFPCFSSLNDMVPEASDSLYSSGVLSAARNSSSVSFSLSRYRSNSLCHEIDATY